MPLPKPKSGESKQDFVSRCMSDEIMKDEFGDKDQRVAVCYSQWEKMNESKNMDNRLSEMMNKYMGKECKKCYHKGKGMGRVTRICQRMNMDRKDKNYIFADFGKGPEEVSKQEILQID